MSEPVNYEPEAKSIAAITKAEGLLLVVINGYKGNGLTCMAKNSAVQALMPELLRRMAKKMEKDIARAAKSTNGKALKISDIRVYDPAPPADTTHAISDPETGETDAPDPKNPLSGDSDAAQ